VTTLYVTHDQSEALALSHEIGVMRHGRLVQVGSPRVIYSRPANAFVADFVGTANFLQGVVERMDASAMRVHVASDVGSVVALATEPLAAGERVVLTTRPEDVELSDQAPASTNRWIATVDQKVYLGEAIDFRVSVAGRLLLARAHPRRTTRIGEALHVAIAPEKLLALKASEPVLP